MNKLLEDLASFVTRSLSAKSHALEKIEMGALDEYQQQALSELSGKALEGYKRTIDNYAVRHAHKKHGNDSNEKQRGQVAVEADDFVHISHIVGDPDQQKNGGTNNIGRLTILSTKELEKGVYCYVEEIRGKQKEIAMQTLYIKKKKG